MNNKEPSAVSFQRSAFSPGDSGTRSKAALFAQAARGPILVLTVGVLFAIQQADILPFSRTWPLIIIVIGLMKLIERLLTPHTPYAQPGAPPR